MIFAWPAATVADTEKRQKFRQHIRFPEIILGIGQLFRRNHCIVVALRREVSQNLGAVNTAPDKCVMRKFIKLIP